MINFPENNPVLRNLALHYSQKLDKSLLSEFLANEFNLNCPHQALIICNHFQELIDVAMLDTDRPDIFAGLNDIENQLFALFNLVYHEMLNLGFEEQWQKASDLARERQNQEENV
mgnify:CR=1 FL=1